MNVSEERDRRRQEAAARVEEWRKLTPQEQLNELDRRLGKGLGAARQRAMIAKRIKEQK